MLIDVYIRGSALGTRCLDCHAKGTNLNLKGDNALYNLMRSKNYEAMKGFKGFLKLATELGASKVDLAELEDSMRRIRRSCYLLTNCSARPKNTGCGVSRNTKDVSPPRGSKRLSLPTCSKRLAPLKLGLNDPTLMPTRNWSNDRIDRTVSWKRNVRRSFLL